MKPVKDLFFPLLSLFSIGVIVFLVFNIVTEFKGDAKVKKQVHTVWNSTPSDNTLRLHSYQGHLKYLEGKINGKECRLLFTTGGGETIIAPSILSEEKVQCKDSLSGIALSHQELTSCIAKNVVIDLGNLKVKQDYVLVKDLMKELPEGSKLIQGIISTKAFEGQRFTIDWVANLITLESDEDLQMIAEKASSLDLKYMKAYNGRGLSLLTDIHTPFGQYWFELDNGNKTNTLNIRRSNEIAAAKQQDYPLHNLKEYTVASLPLLDFCETSEISVHVRNKTLGDGTLGALFFRQWRLTFDLQNDILYCRPNIYNNCFAEKI